MSRLRRIVNKVPGRRFLGNYRFLPFFVLAGALMEFTMIKWHVGEVNFYKTYKKNCIRDAVEEKLRQHHPELYAKN
nr:small integral membrane protein 4 [Nomia melanderi]